MKILVTGSAGFINGYLIQELLDAGYTVIGLDNYSKYGRVEKSYDSHPRYQFVEGNAKDKELLNDLLDGCDHFVASAAMIGGISYFHEFAYDLLAENERITATAFDAALRAHKHGSLQKITVVSSTSGTGIANLLYPDGVAADVNPQLYDYLGGAPFAARPGTLMMDFPDANMIGRIISLNTNK